MTDQPDTIDAVFDCEGCQGTGKDRSVSAMAVYQGDSDACKHCGGSGNEAPQDAAHFDKLYAIHGDRAIYDHWQGQLFKARFPRTYPKAQPTRVGSYNSLIHRGIRLRRDR